MDLDNKVVRFLTQLKSILLNTICRIRYFIILKHLKRKVRIHQINVVFLVNELSKWKAQRLYDLLENDKYFNPIIGLIYADVDWDLNTTERLKKRQILRKYFKDRKMRVVELCDEKTMQVVDLKKFNADIIFYQQPWRLHEKLKPGILSRHHLTCYFPYYVPNYSLLASDCQQGFHYLLWKYYQLSPAWVLTIDKSIPRCVRSVKIVATGHPMLDIINMHKRINTGECKKVIYAPHWSVYSKFFDNAEKYSTFQYNGREILEFAKKHSEIKWYFKPHPTLKISLLRTKLWNEDEIDEYYKEWSRLGEICYGDYVDLFWESSALITDCGSFLVEYPCTKKPIIRLVSSACGIPVPEPSKALFNSYYNVHNLDEMYDIFQEVLIKGLDPKKEERMRAIEKAGLLVTDASINIMKDLYKSLDL